MAYSPLTAKWTKITKTFTDFSAASLTTSVTIFTLPAKGVIHAVQINPTTVFSGGTIATYTISVGITGTTAKYCVATNVFTGATLPVISTTAGVESMSASTSIVANAISTIGTLDAATQGSVSIYILTSTLE